MNKKLKCRQLFLFFVRRGGKTFVTIINLNYATELMYMILFTIVEEKSLMITSPNVCKNTLFGRQT